jgi:murein DD-endopeptidase MepM/ murein hydrolase activator NlpD
MSGKFRDMIVRSFPERQIFYRSRGQVRFLRLSRPIQYGLVCLVFAAVGWVSYASTNLVFRSNIIAQKNERIERINRDYSDLADDLAKTQDKFAAVTDKLEAKHRELQDLFDEKVKLERKVGSLESDIGDLTAERDNKVAELENRTEGLSDTREKLSETTKRVAALRKELADTRSKLERVAHEKDEESQRAAELTALLRERKTDLDAAQGMVASLEQKLLASRNEIAAGNEQIDMSRRENLALNRRVSELEGELHLALDQADVLNNEIGALAGRLERVTAERDAVRDNANSLNKRVASLIESLDVTSDEKSEIADTLQDAQSRLADATEERDTVVRRNNFLAKRVTSLETRLASIRDAQQDLVARLHERTEESVEALESTVALTGLDVDHLVQIALNQNPDAGQGGPLIALNSRIADEAVGMTEGFEASLARLEDQLTRWDGLQQLVRYIPMIRPVDMGYITSSYGKRKDPITKRWAMHHGVDYAGYKRMAIRATAPGTVVFVGRNGPYGRMIEIDHGYGIKTRYGHLNKILVKRGQEVKFRQKIGLMGSSGRSTGPHVHYEIRYKDKPQNPANFIKAGNHVLKD